LSQIETSLNDPNAGEELRLLGTGTQHTYNRNLLLVDILNAEVKGGIELQKDGTQSNFLLAGLKVGFEDVMDRIHEWERLDSAGFSLPYDPDSLELLYVLNSTRDLQSVRTSGYIQNTFTKQYGGGRELRITGGVRSTYWDVNQEVTVSPRFQFSYAPGNYKGYKVGIRLVCAASIL
jgi:hypothetical protein